MSRNGSGVYTLPTGNPVVPSTTITTTWANTTLNDIASTLTQSVASDGQTPMTGALNMNTHNINNVQTLNGVSAVLTGDMASDTATVAGNTTTASVTTSAIIENTTVSASAATGTINYDCKTQPILYYTTNATNNWTMNFRGNSTTTLNSMLSAGQTISVTFIAKQGSTAYYNNVINIDGSATSVVWQGGIAPTSGNASSYDVYTYAITKLATSSFLVLASQTKFA